MQQYLKDTQVKLASLEANSKALNAQYEKAVAVFNEFATKLDKLAKEVEGAVGDADEYKELIKKFSEDAEKLDAHISTLAGRINAVARDATALVRNAGVAKNNMMVYKVAYEKEKAKLEPEINKLKEQLNAQKALVKPELMAKYQAKAGGKFSDVFVSEFNGNCKRCGMNIPASKMASLKNNGIIECENCGRYIYLNR